MLQLILWNGLKIWTKLQFKIFKQKIFKKKIFSSPKTHQAKSSVISNSLYWQGRGGGSPKKVAQNDMKHILVLEFLRSNDFLQVVGGGGLWKS